MIMDKRAAKYRRAAENVINCPDCMPDFFEPMWEMIALPRLPVK